MEGEELNNVISGYFNSCIGIGEAVGPITGGMLVEAIGFRSGLDIVASSLMVFAILFFVVNGDMRIMIPTLRGNNVDIDDDYIKCKEPETTPKSRLPTFKPEI